jgi:hypothetical protein
MLVINKIEGNANDKNVQDGMFSLFMLGWELHKTRLSFGGCGELDKFIKLDK